MKKFKFGHFFEEREQDTSFTDRIGLIKLLIGCQGVAISTKIIIKVCY